VPTAVAIVGFCLFCLAVPAAVGAIVLAFYAAPAALRLDASAIYEVVCYIALIGLLYFAICLRVLWGIHKKRPASRYGAIILFVLALFSVSLPFAVVGLIFALQADAWNKYFEDV
jgi:hypothetical protein